MGFKDLNKNLCFNASIFSRIITKISNENLSFLGVSSSYAFLIVAVKEKPGLRASDLSKILHLDLSTITRLIEKLEYKNFVIRDSDHSSTKIYLTDLGDKAYNNVVIGLSGFQSDLKKVFGKKAVKELNGILRSGIPLLEMEIKNMTKMS